jgi:hypothetical protein
LDLQLANNPARLFYPRFASFKFPHSFSSHSNHSPTSSSYSSGRTQDAASSFLLLSLFEKLETTTEIERKITPKNLQCRHIGNWNVLLLASDYSLFRLKVWNVKGKKSQYICGLAVLY